MKKTLLASAVLMAFATNVAVAADPVSMKGGTFSSAVPVDGSAVVFTSGVTLKGSATIEGKDGALVDVTVKGVVTNNATSEIVVNDFTADGLTSGAGSVLTGKNVTVGYLANSSSQATVNAETLTITGWGGSNEKVNVDNLVIKSTITFNNVDNLNIKDTVTVNGHYVAFGGTGSGFKAWDLLEVDSVYLDRTNVDAYRAEVQVNGGSFKANNLYIADGSWGTFGAYEGGYNVDIKNVNVGEGAVFAVYGSTAGTENLRVGTLTFEGDNTFLNSTTYPLDTKNFDSATFENIVVNGDTNIAKNGEAVKNEYHANGQLHARGLVSLKIGNILLNEGKLTVGQDVEGLDGTLNVVVNEGTSIAFTSNVKAEEINVQLNTLASGAIDATEATVDGATLVTVSGDLNAGADVVEQVKAALAFGDNAYEAVVEEGMYNGAIAIGADGAVVLSENSLMSNTVNLASAAPLTMNRLLMNDVRKRMGDLRAAEGTHGVWARYDGGKLSGANGLENDFTTVQVGIDTVPVADAPRFGVAFAYTKSDADMNRGSADMDAFSLAFYGTKMYDNGMFVDVIGRMATADTDVTVDGDKKGSMDNVALSLSGELGWRFDVTEKFYFEPQAELTYTYVNTDKLALSSGHEYEFDAVDSLMGRVGFAAGFKCPNNFGDVYVRASVVHEFLGDAAVRGGSVLHEVDGKDTWVEYGIGANFNVNKNTYVYADIERTEGAAMDEDWRANVGVRFAF